MNEERMSYDAHGVHIFLDEESALILRRLIEGELNRNDNFEDYFQIKDILGVVVDAVEEYSQVPEEERTPKAIPQTAEYDTFHIVSRYADNDISLWTVNISREDMQKITQNAVRISGEAVEVLNGLPLVDEEEGPMMHFIFADTEDYESVLTVCSCAVDEEMVEKYRYYGCSVRGPVKDVLYDYLTRDDPTVTVAMSVYEAYELSNVADLEIVNCEDAHRKRILEAATAKLEKAIGQVPVPDCEMEEEESDDLEI